MRRLHLVLLSLFITVTSFADDGLSLGAMSQNMLVPMNFLRTSLNAMSIILGFYFFYVAIIRYSRYRSNPQEQPISNVIMCFCIALAFWGLSVIYHYAYLSAVYYGMQDVVSNS